MRILIVTPVSPAQRDGNRNTATRWAEILASLGHDVHVGTSVDDAEADVLVALHATRSLVETRAWRAIKDVVLVPATIRFKS